MGKEAKNVTKTVKFSEKENENDFETVMIKFTHKKNTTHEKAMFYLRVQCPGEWVTTFARVLYELADDSNFANKNKEIKDRFIMGLQDAFSLHQNWNSISYMQQKDKLVKKCNRLNHFVLCSRIKISNVRKIKYNVERYFSGSLTEENKTLYP